MSFIQKLFDQLFEYILTHFRGIFATIFLLPISFLFSLYLTIRNKIVFKLSSAPSKHDVRVQQIQEEIINWDKFNQNNQHQPQFKIKKLCTSRNEWFQMSELVPAYKRQSHKININLRDIIKIDTVNKTVIVEPLATMGQLTSLLLPLGWTLPVVPELDDLTVGGLIMGFGVETSSHKYGLFQHICQSLEIVTAEGYLMRCSAQQNSNIFYMLPWSHGTLGFLVAAELRIIPATPYIRICYQPVRGVDNIIQILTQQANNTEYNEFVETLMFGPDEAVVMTGQFAKKVNNDGTLNEIGKFYKPWFYKHVKSKYLNNNITGIEYIPLRDYYHRHTRSLFWEMEGIISFGNWFPFRYLLGWMLPPNISLLKFTETNTTRRLREKYHLVQDILMPICQLKNTLTYIQQNIKIYPLWLCPFQLKENDQKIGFLHPYSQKEGEQETLFVDVGIYGVPKDISKFDASIQLPELEKFVIEKKGYQGLYAKTMMSREQFRTMFDHTVYDKLRQILPKCQDAFYDIYDKIGGRARVSPFEYKQKQKKTGVAVKSKKN